MNDDELIARLRRTLHEQAEGIHPGPGRVPMTGPVVEVAGATPLTPRPVPGAATTGAAGSGTGEPAEPRTAEYAALPPTGPVPIFGRGRRRWPPVAGVVVIVAAAAAAVTAVTLAGGHHAVTVQPGHQPGNPVSTVPGPVQGAATTVPAAPASLLPAQKAGVVRPVPDGFEPFSVTFVSASDGWVLGWAPCPSAPSDLCATLAATTDGGHRWSAEDAPPITAPGGQPAALGGFPSFEVRFADQRDGWVYTNPGGSGTASRLWSTHDGAATWHQVPVPLSGAAIGRLEAAGGQAHMVLYGPCPSGTPACYGQTQEEVLSTPVDLDDWTPSPVQPPVGAGPVLSPQLTLWGSDGWLINDNRTTVSGARLTAGLGWSSWTPPCASANGPGLLAAWSRDNLVAVCAEGLWGTPDPGTTAGQNWLFRSGDGGGSFYAVGRLPGNQPQSVAVPAGDAATIVVADSQQGLEGSFDAGRTWRTLEPGVGAGASGQPGHLFGYVGFTTATQGVAVAYKSVPTLFMTRDGGHTWSPVSF